MVFYHAMPVRVIAARQPPRKAGKSDASRLPAGGAPRCSKGRSPLETRAPKNGVSDQSDSGVQSSKGRNRWPGVSAIPLSTVLIISGISSAQSWRKGVPTTILTVPS